MKIMPGGGHFLPCIKKITLIIFEIKNFQKKYRLLIFLPDSMHHMVDLFRTQSVSSHSSTEI